MAFSVATVVDNANFKIFEVTALDADSGDYAFSHNFVRRPGNVPVAPQNTVLVPLSAAFFLGQWNFTSADANEITINKPATATGSGGTIRVIAQRPHSMVLG